MNCVRPKWAEIDLYAAEWRIPGAKMKMWIDHIVPLSTQAVDLLRDLHPATGHGRYVFPSMRTGERPMSENTVNAALRGMGYAKDVMTAHRLRGTARTIMENSWRCQWGRASDPLKNLPDFHNFEGGQASHIDAVLDASDAQRWYVVIGEPRK